MRRLTALPILLHRALLRAMAHDFLNLAQSTAYSAMVSLFPALVVAAALVAFIPDNAPIRTQLSLLFDRVLPPDVSPLLESYFTSSPHSIQSTHALVLAGLVSFIGASSVIATIMEGVRRANDLQPDCWTFLQRRGRAFLLVPLSFIPFTIASLLVVFGHFITHWLALHLSPFARPSIYVLAVLLRWSFALAGSIGIIAIIYHQGTPMRQSWKRTLPGAVLATLTWFVTTLAFGWYVTRFANYSQVYGSLGAGIALLFWLYIISLCVLYGAEFNTVIHNHFFPPKIVQSNSLSPNSSPARVELPR